MEIAVDTLKRGIETNCKIGLEDIIKEIEERIPDKSLLISHKLIFKGGHQNFGLIEHKYRNKILLTKIVKSTDSTGDLVIKNVLERNKGFKTITPDIKNILILNELCFITMEKITGYVPKIPDDDLLEKVIEVNGVITQVDYSEAKRILEQKSQTKMIKLQNRHEVFKSLYMINDKQVLNCISHYIKKDNLHLELLGIIDYLDNTIIERRYYKQINPEIHYSLQHGDFFKANMLLDDQTGGLKVIDWVGLNLGPRWVDIAIFLAETRLPIHDIFQNFLLHEKCTYDSIERLFFIYTLIVTWIVTFDEENIEICIHDFLRPALQYFETLICQVESQEKLVKTI